MLPSSDSAGVGVEERRRKSGMKKRLRAAARMKSDDGRKAWRAASALGSMAGAGIENQCCLRRGGRRKRISWKKYRESGRWRRRILAQLSWRSLIFAAACISAYGGIWLSANGAAGGAGGKRREARRLRWRPAKLIGKWPIIIWRGGSLSNVGGLNGGDLGLSAIASCLTLMLSLQLGVAASGVRRLFNLGPSVYSDG